MIPKIIHYCWFGKKEKTDLAKQCIKSWCKYCPDYKLMEWNEDNFDVTINEYVKEAYEAGKWAFVTDYVRLYILYHVGGIYLDTDVELIKNLDGLLHNKAFAGYETKGSISISQVGAIPGNIWIKHCMDLYKEKHFLLESGKYNETTNVEMISQDISDYYHIKLNGDKLVLEDITVYPIDFFFPKNPLSGKMTNLTENTYSIHHFAGSWLSAEEKEKKRRLEKYRRYFGWWIGLQIAEFSLSYEKEGIKGIVDLFRIKWNKKRNK